MDDLWTQHVSGLVAGFGITSGGFAYKLGHGFGIVIMLLAAVMMITAGVFRYKRRTS